jgi:dihydroorotase
VNYQTVFHGAAVLLAFAAGASAQVKYDLLLKGGHLIDPRNKISAARDVAIAGGRVAEVAASIDAASAAKVIDISGLYLTPGIVDIHVHVYAGTGERNSYAGDNSVYPDGFTYRVGVTTVVDAGGAGWRNFEDFKNRIIDRSRTRVLAFLNIVGHGMRGGRYEQDLADMEAKPAAEMAMRYKNLIVGIKSAHFGGPEWLPYDNSIAAAAAAKIPIMVDFGSNRPERTLYDLLAKKYRPGDIYTHCYSGLRGEQGEDGHASAAMVEGRKRGVIFDVGHGGGSFSFGVAAPLMADGFIPDSISTDLHISSMNGGMKDMLNVMDKFLAMGMSLDDVILRSTWNPAKEIGREDLGHLSVGAIADMSVLRVESGDFGFLDMHGARLKGNKRLAAEMTFRDGKCVWDLNGLGRPDWNTLQKGYRGTGDMRWDGVAPTRPLFRKKK